MEEPKTRLIEMRTKSPRGPLKFSGAEVRFLERNELARLATISSGGMPHVVPVSYVFKDEDFLIAVDYGTKKYRNLLRNKAVGLVVDSLRPNRGSWSKVRLRSSRKAQNSARRTRYSTRN